MSVIFGIKNPEEIIIAGDKKITYINDEPIPDDFKKLTVINECVSFVCGGTVAAEHSIQREIEKTCDPSALRTDDVLQIIQDCCENLTKTQQMIIFSHPFACLIAGKNREGTASLISCNMFKGTFCAQEVPMKLYPPADVKMEICNQIFAKNYNLHRVEFVERTIKEVSAASKYVSSSGDKWIYNINVGTGKLYSFE